MTRIKEKICVLTKTFNKWKGLMSRRKSQHGTAKKRGRERKRLDRNACQSENRTNLAAGKLQWPKGDK